MADGDGVAYQILRGEQARPIRGAEARRRIQRELHGVVCQTPVPKAHRDYFYDLRRGRRSILGSLLRYIDLAIMQGVARSVLLTIPEMLIVYINDACDERGDNQPGRAA